MRNDGLLLRNDDCCTNTYCRQLQRLTSTSISLGWKWLCARKSWSLSTKTATVAPWRSPARATYCTVAAHLLFKMQLSSFYVRIMFTRSGHTHILSANRHSAKIPSQGTFWFRSDTAGVGGRPISTIDASPDRSASSSFRPAYRADRLLLSLSLSTIVLTPTTPHTLTRPR